MATLTQKQTVTLILQGQEKMAQGLKDVAGSLKAIETASGETSRALQRVADGMGHTSKALESLSRNGRGADTFLSRAAQRAQRMQNAFRGMAARVITANQTLNLLRNTLTPLIQGFERFIQSGIKFEKTTRQIGALMGDMAYQSQRLAKGVLDLMQVIPASAEDLGRSAYEIVSAGISKTSDALLVLEASSKLAMVGLSSTAEATDIMTSAMNAFQKPASEANRVAEILFGSVNYGKQTIKEMAEGFGAVAPIARSAGVELDELSAAIAALTTGGLEASEAETSLRQAINSLLKPTTQMSQLFEKLKVSSGQELITNAGGLVGALNAVLQAAEGSTEALGKSTGRIQALTALLALTGPAAGQFAKIFDSIKNELGVFDNAVSYVAAATDAKMKLMYGAFERLRIAIVDEARPGINLFFDTLKQKIEALANNSDFVERMGLAISKLAVSALNTLDAIIKYVTYFSARVRKVRDELQRDLQSKGVLKAEGFLGLDETTMTATLKVILQEIGSLIINGTILIMQDVWERILAYSISKASELATNLNPIFADAGTKAGVVFADSAGKAFIGFTPVEHLKKAFIDGGLVGFAKEFIGYNIINPLSEYIAGAGQTIIDKMQSTWPSNFASFFLWLFYETIEFAIENAVAMLSLAAMFARVIPVFGWLAGALIDIIVVGVTGGFDRAIEAALKIWRGFGDTFSGIAEGIWTGNWQRMRDGFRAVVDNMGTFLVESLGAAFEVVISHSFKMFGKIFVAGVNMFRNMGQEAQDAANNMPNLTPSLPDDMGPPTENAYEAALRRRYDQGVKSIKELDKLAKKVQTLSEKMQIDPFASDGITAFTKNAITGEIQAVNSAEAYNELSEAILTYNVRASEAAKLGFKIPEWQAKALENATTLAKTSEVTRNYVFDIGAAFADVKERVDEAKESSQQHNDLLDAQTDKAQQALDDALKQKDIYGNYLVSERERLGLADQLINKQAEQLQGLIEARDYEIKLHKAQGERNKGYAQMARERIEELKVRNDQDAQSIKNLRGQRYELAGIEKKEKKVKDLVEERTRALEVQLKVIQEISGLHEGLLSYMEEAVDISGYYLYTEKEILAKAKEVNALKKLEAEREIKLKQVKMESLMALEQQKDGVKAMSADQKTELELLRAEIPVLQTKLAYFDELNGVAKQYMQILTRDMVKVNPGDELLNSVNDAFEGMAKGTLKLEEVWTSLRDSMIGTFATAFTEILKKKAKFDTVIFNNTEGIAGMFEGLGDFILDYMGSTFSGLSRIFKDTPVLGDVLGGFGEGFGNKGLDKLKKDIGLDGNASPAQIIEAAAVTSHEAAATSENAAIVATETTKTTSMLVDAISASIAGVGAGEIQQSTSDLAQAASNAKDGYQLFSSGMTTFSKGMDLLDTSLSYVSEGVDRPAEKIDSAANTFLEAAKRESDNAKQMGTYVNALKRGPEFFDKTLKYGPAAKDGAGIASFATQLGGFAKAAGAFARGVSKFAGVGIGLSKFLSQVTGKEGASTGTSMGGALGEGLMGTQFGLQFSDMIGGGIQKALGGGTFATMLGNGIGGSILPVVGTVLGSVLSGDAWQKTVGGAIGAAVGSWFGPIGTMVGSTLGSFIGGLFVKKPSDRELTRDYLKEFVESITSIKVSKGAANDGFGGGSPFFALSSKSKELVQVLGLLIAQTQKTNLAFKVVAYAYKVTAGFLSNALSTTLTDVKEISSRILNGLELTLTSAIGVYLKAVDSLTKGSQARWLLGRDSDVPDDAGAILKTLVEDGIIPSIQEGLAAIIRLFNQELPYALKNVPEDIALKVSAEQFRSLRGRSFGNEILGIEDPELRKAALKSARDAALKPVQDTKDGSVTARNAFKGMVNEFFDAMENGRTGSGFFLNNDSIRPAFEGGERRVLRGVTEREGGHIPDDRTGRPRRFEFDADFTGFYSFLTAIASIDDSGVRAATASIRELFDPETAERFLDDEEGWGGGGAKSFVRGNDGGIVGFARDSLAYAFRGVQSVVDNLVAEEKITPDKNKEFDDAVDELAQRIKNGGMTIEEALAELNSQFNLNLKIKDLEIDPSQVARRMQLQQEAHAAFSEGLMSGAEAFAESGRAEDAVIAFTSTISEQMTQRVSEGMMTAFTQGLNMDSALGDMFTAAETGFQQLLKDINDSLGDGDAMTNSEIFAEIDNLLSLNADNFDIYATKIEALTPAIEKFAEYQERIAVMMQTFNQTADKLADLGDKFDTSIAGFLDDTGGDQLKVQAGIALRERNDAIGRLADAINPVDYKWEARMKKYGFTDDQIAEYQASRGTEAIRDFPTTGYDLSTAEEFGRTFADSVLDVSKLTDEQLKRLPELLDQAADAVAANAEAQISALEQQLSLAQEWVDLMPQAREALDKVKNFGRNIKDTENLDTKRDEISRLIKDFNTGTEAEKIAAAKELTSLGPQFLEALQSAGISPGSAEFETQRATIQDTLEKIVLAGAQREAEAIDIQKRIEQVQAAAVAELTALKTITDNARQEALDRSERAASAAEQTSASIADIVGPVKNLGEVVDVARGTFNLLNRGINVRTQKGEYQNKMSLDEFPALAKGGLIVPDETLAVLHGPEAVIPLDKLSGLFSEAMAYGFKALDIQKSLANMSDSGSGQLDIAIDVAKSSKLERIFALLGKGKGGALGDLADAISGKRIKGGVLGDLVKALGKGKGSALSDLADIVSGKRGKSGALGDLVKALGKGKSGVLGDIADAISDKRGAGGPRGDDSVGWLRDVLSGREIYVNIARAIEARTADAEYNVRDVKDSRPPETRSSTKGEDVLFKIEQILKLEAADGSDLSVFTDPAQLQQLKFALRKLLKDPSIEADIKALAKRALNG